MALGDEEKTAFITSHGLYCYRVMPFGLKNVGATYRRLMTKIFKPLIGDVVEVQMRIWCKLREVPGVHGYPKRNRNQSRSGESDREHACTNKQEGVATPHWQTRRPRTVHSSIHKQDEAFLPGTQIFTDWAVSTVLLRSLSSREQRPVYFISKALADPALALRTAVQKLRPYFQAHPITVLTNQPLRNILHKSDITGRMLQWAIELRIWDRLSTQTIPEGTESTPDDWWFLHVDGASRSSGSGVGLLLKAPTGEQLEQSIRLEFPASNNEAEYEAILSGLGLAITLNASKVKIHSDSQLIVGQIRKEYEAKDERMAKYLLKVQESLSRLGEWVIEKIPRRENVQADALAGIAASFPEYDWAVDIRAYLQTGALPEDPKHAHKVRVQASRFTLIGMISIGDPSEVRVCGNHSRGRTLAHRAHSQGYYWPTMKQDAEIYAKKCDKCQKHAPIPHMPAETLNSVEAHASIKEKGVKRFLRGTSHQKPVFHAALPGVLWAYRTTPGRPTWNTPFALAYGTDAVIPTEVGMPTARTAVQGQRNEDDKLARHLDWADETREAASIRMAAYQQKVVAYYNRKVRPRVFKEGSLVATWLPLLWPRISDPLRHMASLIPHGDYMTTDVPPSPDISQQAPAIGWKRSAIQLPQSNMSGSAGDAYPEYICDQRFRLPGQLDSSNTRDLPNPFLPTIKKQTLTTLSTKSLELSLIFNTRYA
ncbi:hypothetical protein AAG906_003089 [Vitis piasezkii]